MMESKIIYFDIGETLGTAVISPETSRLKSLAVYSYIIETLQDLKNLNSEIGIISNTGNDGAESVNRVLGASGIFDYFNPELLLYSKELGIDKSSIEIFEIALARAARVSGEQPFQCLFVGENRSERKLAHQSGMKAALHPILARAVLENQRLEYIQIFVPIHKTVEDLRTHINELPPEQPVLPLKCDWDELPPSVSVSVIAISTSNAAQTLERAGFRVEFRAQGSDPAISDLFLMRDYDQQHDAGFAALSAEGAFDVNYNSEGLVLALQSGVPAEEYSFSHAFHGHTLQLIPNAFLLEPFAAVALEGENLHATLHAEELATLQESITESILEEYINRFTGLDPLYPNLGNNRHVLSPQMPAITQALAAEFTKIGGDKFEVEGHRFEVTAQDLQRVLNLDPNYRAELWNVVAELPGESDELVLVTAHLDSTSQQSHNSNYDPRIHLAPGTDDDCSGIAGVFAIAKFFRHLFSDRRPKRTIRFVLFNAEEQGLIGSQRYARLQRDLNAPIVAVFQMDMIGYNTPGTPNTFEVHAGFSRVELQQVPPVEQQSLLLANLIKDMSQLLADSDISILEPAAIHRSPDGAAGRSDHASFHCNGYAACVTSEKFFPSPGTIEDPNPNYHKKEDTFIDYPYATSMARVVCAAALRVVEPYVELPTPDFAAFTGVTKQINGCVLNDEDGQPVPRAKVTVYASVDSQAFVAGTYETDSKGTFQLGVPEAESYYLVIESATGKLLKSTHETPFICIGESCEIIVDIGQDIEAALSANSFTLADKGETHQIIKLGGYRFFTDKFEDLTPDNIYEMARSLVNPSESDRRIAFSSFAPGELDADDPKRTLCGTQRLAAFYDLIHAKNFANERDILLRVDNILAMRESGFASQFHYSEHFQIEYQTDGPAAVEEDFSEKKVFDPGSNPPVLLATLSASNVPAYIRLIEFWLERSLELYISSPFSMRNPAANGKIRVIVNSDGFGAATPQEFYINNALPDDVVCAVAVHELFHMVQYEYDSSSSNFPVRRWRDALFEGGATFAEDTVADGMNRYLDEAGSNFGGEGLLAHPNQSLFVRTARYKSSLFWRYVAEQHSPLQSEPTIGVDTYRRILEKCVEGNYTTDDLKNAIRSLQGVTDFYEFSYLDSDPEWLISSETTFGNFALACYLKDLDNSSLDKRFTFLENKENIHIDDVIIPYLGLTISGSDTLTPVARQTESLTTNQPLIFNSFVESFASQYFEVEVNSDISSVRINFEASPTLQSLIFQIVLIDENSEVRDIIRSDRRQYTKQVANGVNNVKLEKVVCIISGGDSRGNFQLSVTAVEAAPDVSITRWNSLSGKEYELDPREFDGTWVSPDLWFQSLEDGSLRVFIRLQNKGNADTDDIQIDLEYRSLSDLSNSGAWLPLRDENGNLQSLERKSLAAGESNEWSLPWQPEGQSFNVIYSLRAKLMVASDPNTDNKTAVSNLGFTLLEEFGSTDICMICRNSNMQAHTIYRHFASYSTPNIEVAARDCHELAKGQFLKPNEELLAAVRLNLFQTKKTERTAASSTFPGPFKSIPRLTLFDESDGKVLNGATVICFADP